MKNEHKHFLARLLVGAFLVLGLGFWMTNFVVKADSWTVGTITRNNANFLSGAFWDNNPTSGDIIKALYGSGGGQTAYTQNWSGYTSGSCLSGGMNVITTGILPTTLTSNTIYVLASGTYTITTGITMNECSALISSGIVTLSGNVGGSGTITATNKNNIIIEKIRINQTNNGNNGFMMQGLTNLTIKDTQAYNNIGTTSAGLLISGTSYITIINTQFYSNANGIYAYNSTHIFGQNIQTRNNRGMGIQILYGKSIILSGITSYDNNNIGFFLRNSTLITINNLTGNNNVYHGLMVLNSSGNILDTINVYDNGRRGIFLNSSDQNTLQNIISIHNENGISISNSTGNILSGVTVYGNYYGGIDLYNTNYTTGNNITSNSSSGCLYLNNSSYNNFANVTTINSPDNGVALFQSNHNILSGLVSSGNMGHGVYMANSNNNTIYASTIKYNYRVGMVIETGTSNSILYSTLNNNGLIGFDGNGILLSFCSGTIINSGDLSTNQDHGISLDSSTNTQIINSIINNNQDQGIVFMNSSTNSITGSFLSGNNGGLYFLQNSNDNIITNTVNLVSYIGAGTTIFNSTGNTFYLYSGSNIIEHYSSGGYFYTTTYDVFTTTHNNIRLNSYDFAIVTGNTLSVGSSFPVYFTTLGIEGTGYDFFSLSGVASFTVSGANRDGAFYTPTKITTGIKKASLGETGTSLISQFYDTIEVISGSTNLHMNSGTGTITYHILSGFNGQYLSILQSVDGNTWSLNTLQSGCMLDAFKTCYFTTNGDIKLFAFGAPGLFFTGTTQSLSTVISGGYYNTGISITFTGDSIATHTINGTLYTGGTLMTGNGTYTFLLSNIRGTTTGMKFTIDTIAPTLAGVVSGVYYNHNTTIIGSDTNFSGFKLSGTWYAGTSLTVTGEGVRVLTGYDKAGNTTGVTFTIDKTTPTFTGETIITNTPIISGGYYNEADVFINFSDLNISGATISGLNNSYYTGNFGGIDTFNTGGIYKFTVFDRAGNSTGMIFTIDITNPVMTGNYPTSGLNYTGGNTMTFTRTGTDTNMSGYTLYINSTGYTMGTATSYTTGLINGTYTRHVIGTDRAGNTGTSQIYPFIISTPFTGNISITGTPLIGSRRFTNSAVGIYMRANEPVTYTITGHISNAPVTGLINTQRGRSIAYPTLTGLDGSKDIYVSIKNTSGVIISKTFLAQLDTVAAIPTLTSPASGTSVAGAFTLSWSVGIDSAGISGYQYFISPTSGFGTILASGSTTATSVTIPNSIIGMSGILYRKVESIDKVGNIGTSVIQPFYYSGTVSDIIPDQFTFNTITSATINHIYGSNTLTITGINTPVLASITRGVLYISGVMVGTTGYVQNGWTVKIEMNSSIDYDTLVTSTLNIGGVTSIFRITTETEADANNNTDYTHISTDLSTTERLQIIAIFEALRDVYDGVKQEEFFSSFMVMLQSKIDDLGTSTSDNSKRDALQYLYDLADQYNGNGGTNTTDIAGTSRIVNGIYTAPNGKKYRITYDSVKKQFTSTNFVTPKYYPTLDVLKYDIDRNNPLGSQYADAKAIKARWGRVSIDGTRQTSPYTAPNHKVFYFFKNTDGQISSYTFTTQRYFDSLDATKEFIHNSNLK